MAHNERTEDVKIAKASQADLNMAMDLTAMLETLGHRHCPAMPAAIARNDGDEDFDRDDNDQCGRALRALLETANRGSLSRVVWGAAVMLDPRNKLVDPTADTIEHHPERSKASDILAKEVRDADELLRILRLDPSQYRTDSGAINMPRVRAALANV